MTFEERFHQIVPLEYDFDTDALSIDQTNQILALINQMPVNNRQGEEDLTGQTFHAEGWCEAESTYIDVTINRIAGIGFHAFCGSENMLEMTDEDIAVYKEAFGADVNSVPVP